MTASHGFKRLGRAEEERRGEEQRQEKEIKQGEWS